MNHVTEYQVIYTGAFTEEDFHFDVVPGKRVYPVKIRHLISVAWREARLNPDLTLFNGPAVSLLSAVMTRHPDNHRYRLYLKVQATDYKHFYAISTLSPNLIYKSDRANALAACAVVETTDGTIFVGRRNQNLAEEGGMWHIPGGTLEHAINPLDFMRQELDEELNIQAKDIQSAVCLGFAEHDLKNKSEFLCYFHLNLSERQVTRKLADAEDRDEHDEFVFVPLEELEDFTDIYPFAPIGKAAVRLYLDFVTNNRRQNA
jgi:ADP-ribose pyrophosphatase YjhB (NUDIX family)